MGPSDKIWKPALALLVVCFLYFIFRPNCLGCGRETPSRLSRASTDLIAIESMLRTYAYDTKSFPTSDQGLERLYNEQYNIQQYGNIPITKDPWGRAYIYYISEPDNKIVVSSLGADGKIGGEGEESDTTISIDTQKFFRDVIKRNRTKAAEAERAIIEADNAARQILATKIKRIPNDLEFIREFVELYRLELGKYPTTTDDIEAFLKTSFITINFPQSKILKDPWGRNYLYRTVNVKNQIDIYTLGADGYIGGSGPNKDVHHKKKSGLPQSLNELTLILEHSSNLTHGDKFSLRNTFVREDMSLRDYYIYVLFEKLFYR